MFLGVSLVVVFVASLPSGASTMVNMAAGRPTDHTRCSKVSHASIQHDAVKVSTSSDFLKLTL